MLQKWNCVIFRFSTERLNNDLSQVGWNDIFLKANNDIDKFVS